MPIKIRNAFSQFQSIFPKSEREEIHEKHRYVMYIQKKYVFLITIIIKKIEKYA